MANSLLIQISTGKNKIMNLFLICLLLLNSDYIVKKAGAAYLVIFIKTK